MNFTFVSFTQGTSAEDPSQVAIIVKYNDREICYTTYFTLDWTIAQDSDDYNAAIAAQVASVQACCSPTIPNPSYDSNLTSCWV